MPVRDCLQPPPSRAVGLGKSASMTEWAVGDDGDPVALAPRDHRMLDCTLAQMVEHLIASGFGRSRDLAHFIEIIHVEIADAPRQDLAVGAEPLEGGDGVRKGMRPPPVEKIAIEAGGLEPL